MPSRRARATTIAAVTLGLVAASFMGLLAGFVPARAEAAPLPGEVVWARDGRVFIALVDSMALEPGALVTFARRGKTLATGEISGVYAGGLAMARLTSGSLGRVKKLASVRMTADLPALRSPPLLRVGLPSGARSCALFACRGPSLRSPAPAGTYRAESLDARSSRLVRDAARAAGGPWPDTLLLRLFDDSADQEIALQRGELDLAIFWPGELSAHLREQPRWRAPLMGLRDRGVLAAVSLGKDAGASRGSPAAPDLGRLNRELFGGDLAPWPVGTAGAAESATASAGEPGDYRFEVDPACPGQRKIERFLDSGGGDGDRARVRLFPLDLPARAPDSLAWAAAEYVRRGSFASGALRARAESLLAERGRDAAAGRTAPPGARLGAVRDALGVSLLFALRCPVVCAPELRPYVRALGIDAWVNVLACAPPP